VAGPTGPTGPTGAVSTTPGPTGPTGAVSTTPGPTGPTGAVSTTPGPTGPTGAGATPGGSNTQVQYNSSGSFAGSSSFTFNGTAVYFPETSNTYSGTPTLNSDAYYVGASGAGYFADYDCLTSNFAILAQSQDQTGIAGGGIRDTQFFQQQDGDTNNYTAVGQKVSNAVRGVVTGKFNGTTFDTQYKDLVGATFAAVGRIGWTDRGVSGINTEAIQYGAGIASNEFAAQNPSSASEQSISMAAVQALILPQRGASDSSHKYRGVLVQNNQGYRSTSAFESITTAGIGSFTGNFEYGLHLSGSTVETAAITMPVSSTGSVGTTISYDTGDNTYYDRTNNAYFWNIGGNYIVKAESGRITNYLSGGGATFRSLDATSYTDLYTTSGSTVLANGGGGIVAFYNAGTERFRIGSNGEWGIAGANYGSLGQYLKSNGSGTPPSWSSVQPRVLASTANSATPTLNTDNYDMMVITVQSVAITSFTTNLTGTPVNGQKLWISITGTTSIGITWGASFEASTTPLPTTTVTTTRLDVGFVWNVATGKWRCVASA
jgi:hypothetical protein